MNLKHFIAFAPPTPNLGELNQLRGVLSALMRFHGDGDIRFAYNMDMCFENVSDTPLRRHLYVDDAAFARDVGCCLDVYFSRHLLVPRVLAVACSQGENENACPNADAMCRAVKSYYERHQMGKLVTVVVNSRMYPYVSADVVHICGHLLTDEERRNLKAGTDGGKKFFISEGIIHNMSRVFIRQKFWQPKIRKVIEVCRNGRPNVVFSLGGRVDGDEIRFTLSHAEVIWRRLSELNDKGYNIIVVNGPRTPNDVTDYFYEHSLATDGRIMFFNSKPVAQTDEERASERWRIYSGRHEEAFIRQASEVGNVYPGVLGLDNTLAVHTFDSFASCETAASGIPTAICRWVEIDEAVRPDCYRLADLLKDGGYVIDFVDFDGSVEPKDLKLKLLPNSNYELAEKIKRACAAG